MSDIAPRKDLGNHIAREGVDRCHCGCKYWENDQCIDCGTHVSRISRRWVSANNGSGKRKWFVCRENAAGKSDDYHNTTAGELIRYGSHDAAQKVADQLNAQEEQ